MNYKLLLCTLFIAHCAHGMFAEKHLNEIEKQLFLNEAHRIGKEVAIQQILATPDPRPNKRFGVDSFVCFSLKTRINPQENDPLTQHIVQTITDKEKKDGYIPETITTEHKQLGIIMRLPNNYLGENDETTYWHKKDKNGAYIELKSEFYNKQHLLEILNNQ